MAEELTTLADRYVLEEKIASGGMATVWRARDNVLARPVAVKILHPHLTSDDTFVGRFRIEALAAARLSHPNIVAIYDTGSDPHIESGTPIVIGEEPRYFIVMEHCGSGTLGGLLEMDGPMDGDRVAALGATICDALSYAHHKEVIHRDIKPANVLISDHGNLKVTDFGIAKAAFAAKDITTTGSIIGTVTYLSPEQAQGSEPDVRSDLYSLGVVLYELVTGRPPFKEETDVATALKHVHEMPPSPRSLRAGVPRYLDDIIMTALAKAPRDRFQTAEEMRSALRRMGAEPTQEFFGPRRQEPRPESVMEPPRRPRRGLHISPEVLRLIPIIVFIAAAITAAVLIGSALTSREPTGSGGGNGGNGGGNGGSALSIASAHSFDPASEGGDGVEHEEEVGNSFDGDAATTWSTEDYDDSISLLKEGVGLLYDLGNSSEVAQVEIAFDRAGYVFEVRAADEAGDVAGDFELVGESDGSGEEEVVDVQGTTARYWLVWITELPGGGGGRGAIAEVRFVGS
jgi:serine/threonine-protein kinase